MYKTKPGVALTGLQPEVHRALLSAEAVWSRHGFEVVVTSGLDGKHMPGSRHYTGNAFDLRTTRAGMRHAVVRQLCEELRVDLGPDYDVVVEPDHVHVEYDPKPKKEKA